MPLKEVSRVINKRIISQGHLFRQMPLLLALLGHLFVICAVLRCSSTSGYAPLLGSLMPRAGTKIAAQKQALALLSHFCVTFTVLRCSRTEGTLRCSAARCLELTQNSGAQARACSFELSLRYLRCH